MRVLCNDNAAQGWSPSVSSILIHFQGALVTPHLRLCPDGTETLAEIYRMLKPGGAAFLSIIYCIISNGNLIPLWSPSIYSLSFNRSAFTAERASIFHHPNPVMVVCPHSMTIIMQYAGVNCGTPGITGIMKR